jgi:prepilin-type N-terminal cleavage/methylation domain-containing protein
LSVASKFSGARDSGFTIIEAIVALVIFASAFVIAQYALGRGMQDIRIGDREAEALEIARSVLQSAGTAGAIKDALHDAGVRDGMSWELSVSKYIPEAPPETPTKIDGYWVTVDVDWRDSGLRSRKLTLKTLKLLPSS